MTELTAGAAASVEALMGQVADEFTARLQRGERPDVEEYARRHPAIAELLREALPALQALASGDALPSSSTLRELGDFRIVREVGRGGMGIVYEAEQLSLGRRVALKVLPFAATMDPRHLQRFKNEARAAASLHHEHIVPIHGVGEEGGVHFYAMQFIDGCALAEVLAGLRGEPAAAQPGEPGGPPTPGSQATVEGRKAPMPPAGPRDAAHFRRVAEWGAQAADALEHAHSRGIVHRDVKPANLMIDGQGKLWVADFGLARTAADAGLTMTGDVIGTLRYMSPEQALAQHGLVDHRTDVYALGVTLYELLTLRPAVEGKGREEIMKRLALDEPSAPRNWNRTIPIDLETVVLKALAKESAGRYATARELADDLRRFVDNRPVCARRPSLAQRARKWAGRHRALVRAAVSLLALAGAGLAVASALIWREREQTQQALSEAKDNFQQARRAVDEMYTQVAEQWLRDEPKLTEVQLGFLEKALRFYEDFARRQGRDGELVLDRARASRRVGAILTKLTRDPEAEQAFERAAALLEEAPNSPERDLELARVQLDWSALLIGRGRHVEAERALGRGLDILGRLPSDPERLALAARLSSNLGVVLQWERKFEESERHYRHAVPASRKLAEEAPTNPSHLTLYATVLGKLGVIRALRKDRDEAEDLIRQAIPIQEKAVQLAPRVASYRHDLRGQYAALAEMILLPSGKVPAALEPARRSLALAERLVEDFPDVPHYLTALADSSAGLGKILKALGGPENLAEAERAYRRAVTTFDDCMLRLPERPVAKVEVAQTAAEFAILLRASGQVREAIGNYRRALKLVPEGRLAWCNNLAWLLGSGADPDFRDTAELLRVARRAAELGKDAAMPQTALGLALYRDGKVKDALAILQRARSLPRGTNVYCALLLAMVHHRLADDDAARHWYASVADYLRTARVDEPEFAALHREARMLLRIGMDVEPRKDLPLNLR